MEKELKVNSNRVTIHIPKLLDMYGDPRSQRSKKIFRNASNFEEVLVNRIINK